MLAKIYKLATGCWLLAICS